MKLFLALTMLAVSDDTIYQNGFEALACPAIIMAPDGPRTWLKRSNVGYGAYPGVNGTRSNVDITEWDNVWGYNGTQPGPPWPWPGVSGSAPIFKNFRRDSYVALHFHTPAAPNPFLASTFVNPTANPGPGLTMAISYACGDFYASLPTAGCLKEDVPSADAPMVYWQFRDTSPATACNLMPNTDYWVNIMQTDRNSTVECSSSTVCPAAAWRQ